MTDNRPWSGLIRSDLIVRGGGVMVVVIVKHRYTASSGHCGMAAYRGWRYIDLGKEAKIITVRKSGHVKSWRLALYRKAVYRGSTDGDGDDKSGGDGGSDGDDSGGGDADWGSLWCW